MPVEEEVETDAYECAENKNEIQNVANREKTVFLPTMSLSVSLIFHKDIDVKGMQKDLSPELLQNLPTDDVEELLFAIESFSTKFPRHTVQFRLALVECIFVGNPIFSRRFQSIFAASVGFVSITDTRKREVEMSVAASGNKGIVEERSV